MLWIPHVRIMVTFSWCYFELRSNNRSSIWTHVHCQSSIRDMLTKKSFQRKSEEEKSIYAENIPLLVLHMAHIIPCEFFVAHTPLFRWHNGYARVDICAASAYLAYPSIFAFGCSFFFSTEEKKSWHKRSNDFNRTMLQRKTSWTPFTKFFIWGFL